MTKLKIKVTKDILKRSMYCTNDFNIATNCAIAVAVRDIFPNASVGLYCMHANIFREDTDFKNPDIGLPDEATNFIKRFDRLASLPEQRLLLPELEFEVEIPDVIVDSIDIEGIKKLLQNHPTLELV